MLRLDGLRHLALALLATAACTGDPGPAGTPGPAGPPGPDGPSGVLDPTLSPLDKAFLGAGGKPALEHLTSFRVDSDGARWFPGEQFTLEDPAPLVHTYHSTLAYDVANDQLRLDMQRHMLAFGTDSMQTYSEIIRGDLGAVAGSDGLFGGFATLGPSPDLDASATAAIRKQHRLLNPQLILRDVAANPALATAGGVAMLGDELHDLLVIADDVYPITLYVNARTGRIDKLSTRENDHVQRDVDIDVFYRDWGTADGVQFPGEVDLFVAGQLVQQETRANVATNVPIAAADLELPAGAAPVADPVAARDGAVNHHFHQGFSGAGLRFDPIQGLVQATQLAPGVFYLQGGSHHSLAIEQSNGVVIVEAPLYGARSKAVRDWAAIQFPGKPISHVVVTHFHDDHSGGVREMAAAGATVVSDERSQQFLRAAFTARSTIDPDTMASHPRSVAMLGVSPLQPLTLPDATRPVVVHSIPNTHAYDMVIVSLPQQKIVFESDLFSPGFPPGLPKNLPTQLRDRLVTLGLTDSLIAGGHGATATFADLQAAIAR